MRVLILGLLIGVPASALYPVMPTSGFAVALMFVAFIGKSVATAGGPAAMALIAPGEIRGQSLAIYNSFIAQVGPLLGPSLVGWMIDHTGNTQSIGVITVGYGALRGCLAGVWFG